MSIEGFLGDNMSIGAVSPGLVGKSVYSLQGDVGSGGGGEAASSNEDLSWNVL